MSDMTYGLPKDISFLHHYPPGVSVKCMDGGYNHCYHPYSIMKARWLRLMLQMMNRASPRQETRKWPTAGDTVVFQHGTPNGFGNGRSISTNNPYLNHK